MSAIGRAIWFIESHFARDISLEEIAEAAGLSRFHLSRVFGLVTGRSISAYIRARRLSGAARNLADGSSSILAVALEAGYGSHEAFTRAFREQFGVTPETVRKQGHLSNIALTEPIRMDDTRLLKLDPPRFEDSPPLLLAGLAETYAYGRTEGIPSLWQRFNTHFGNIPGQKGNVAYGVCSQSDGEAGTFPLYGGSRSRRRRRPARRLYDHEAAEAALRRVPAPRPYLRRSPRRPHHIFGTWLPKSGLQHGQTPDLIERYDDRFDPHSGMGVVEMWIPIQA